MNSKPTWQPFLNARILKFLLYFAVLNCMPVQKSAAAASKYIFRAITNNEGLSHNTIYDICQDARGFMWFATDGGLDRYDGQDIRQYRMLGGEHSLPSNSMISLLSTRDGNLFVGTSGGVALYRSGTDDFEQIRYQNKSLGETFGLQPGFGNEVLISTTNRGAFIYDYGRKTFQPLTFLKEHINDMTTDREGFYWAYSRFTLYRFNKKHQIVREYHVGPMLFNSAISYVRTDRKGILWIGTYDKGLFAFDFKTQRFQPVVFPNGADMYFIRSVEVGENPDEYWVGTEKGLYIVNLRTRAYQHYVQSFDKMAGTLSDNAIYKVYRNRQNVAFVGTFFGGINVASNRRKGFTAMYPDDRPGYLHGKALSCMAKAPDGNLWIATEDAGIAILDKSKGTFTHLLADERNPGTISTNNVHALLMDGSCCWAGHFMGGITKIDIRTRRAQRFMDKQNNPLSLNSNFVFALHFLSKDSILVGTVSGMQVFDKKSGTFSPFRAAELDGCFVHDMFTAADGRIWICTYNRGIFILDKKSRNRMLHHQLGDRSGLPGNSIISHLVDSKGRVWLGTRDAGLCLYDAKNRTFRTWDSRNMLPNNVVYGILEDNRGMIWISSNKGISRLNFTDSTSTHFNYKQGIAGNQYSYKSYFKDEDGVLYFGSVTGLTSFQPDDLLPSKEKPAVYFNNFKLFNENVLPKEGGVLSKQIDFCDKIRLKHNQNSFTLEFSSVDYLGGDIAYEYFLEGLDKNWSPISEKRQANYTNLSPGQYVFHIRAINRTSNIRGPERTLRIVVASPFWASWFAFLLYFFLLIILARLLYRNYQSRQNQKMALTIEKIEKENLNLLHQHKMNFFTNISHEFKTPLSIIVAAVDMLSRRKNHLADEGDEILQSIQRSATKLQALVNQLMEFRKVETEHAEIHATQGNMVDFVNQLLNGYGPLLSRRNIQLKVQTAYTDSQVFFDYDKMEKILTNLMTNAVKYTPENGAIECTMSLGKDFMEFSVKDSGKGLTVAQKERIFDTFYSDDQSNDTVESSGIGLALTAGLVKLLKGRITVESEPGKGCSFVVWLPLQPLETTNPQRTYDTDSPQLPIAEAQKPAVSDQPGSDTDTNLTTGNNDFNLVIAEDNKDLLLLLQKHFRESYRVKCFENGQDAWNYIQEKTPDLVITDVMMPVMSGTELCTRIKTDIRFCHIPVLMLTAKTTPEARLEGLQTGADAYVAKPFSMEELDVRIRNILTTRLALKEKLAEMASLDGLPIPALNHEQAFVEKILALVQQNIANDQLDVHFLAEKLNISRSNLHTKLKNLLQMNTTEFIQTVRINKAKELITTTNLTLAEIAFKVGFSDAAYFTRVFKKMTGATPGGYRRGEE